MFFFLFLNPRNIIQTNIDECLQNECENGSTCIDDINKYVCGCLPGYTGDFCEDDINECDKRPCEHAEKGNECNNMVNDYSCNCLKGFTGKNCTVCENPELCNLSDGCCVESIVFNSRRDLKIRSKIQGHHMLTDFFGIYKLYKYDDQTGTMIFEKGIYSSY